MNTSIRIPKTKFPLTQDTLAEWLTRGTASWCTPIRVIPSLRGREFESHRCRRAKKIFFALSRFRLVVQSIQHSIYAYIPFVIKKKKKREYNE